MKRIFLIGFWAAVFVVGMGGVTPWPKLKAR